MSAQLSDVLNRLQLLLRTDFLLNGCGGRSQYPHNVGSRKNENQYQLQHRERIDSLISASITSEECRRTSTQEEKEDGLPSSVLLALKTLKSAMDDLSLQIDTYGLPTKARNPSSENGYIAPVRPLGMRNHSCTDEGQGIASEPSICFGQNSK